MKNKKGFTLIELLAVIIILLIILSIAVPPLMNVLNSSRTKSYEVTVKQIIQAAKYYVADHPENVGYTDFISTEVPIVGLCQLGYLTCPIYNPDTEEEMVGYVIISLVGDTFEYEYVDEQLN